MSQNMFGQFFGCNFWQLLQKRNFSREISLENISQFGFGVKQRDQIWQNFAILATFKAGGEFFLVIVAKQNGYFWLLFWNGQISLILI